MAALPSLFSLFLMQFSLYLSMHNFVSEHKSNISTNAFTNQPSCGFLGRFETLWSVCCVSHKQACQRLLLCVSTLCGMHFNFQVPGQCILPNQTGTACFMSVTYRQLGLLMHYSTKLTKVTHLWWKQCPWAPFIKRSHICTHRVYAYFYTQHQLYQCILLLEMFIHTLINCKYESPSKTVNDNRVVCLCMWTVAESIKK